MKITKGQAAVAIIIVTILLDQLIKIWVKTHFYLGEELKITEWFRLRRQYHRLCALRRDFQ